MAILDEITQEIDALPRVSSGGTFPNHLEGGREETRVSGCVGGSGERGSKLMDGGEGGQRGSEETKEEEA